MALLNIGSDPWLLEYESCDKLQSDIMEQLALRQREHKHSDNFTRISATIRIRLKQFTTELTQLKQKLKNSSSEITSEEWERRSRQVELLESKRIKMQKEFEDVTWSRREERTQLFGHPSVSDWKTNDDQLLTVDPASYTVNDLKSQQKKMLEDQERGLESLSQIISRQKNIAENISTEVDLHNEIIEDLGDHIDRTDARLSNETQQIGVVDRKDKTCVYWVTIILLFIAIVIVAIV